jgi:hypothetical protein
VDLSLCATATLQRAPIVIKEAARTDKRPGRPDLCIASWPRVLERRLLIVTPTLRAPNLQRKSKGASCIPGKRAAEGVWKRSSGPTAKAGGPVAVGREPNSTAERRLVTVLYILVAGHQRRLGYRVCE